MSFLKRFDEALDKAFAPKVDKFKVLEDKVISEWHQRDIQLTQLISNGKNNCDTRNKDMQILILELEKVKAASDIKIELNDLKTRIERIEIYSGMTRKTDPSKPPELKSAFQL